MLVGFYGSASKWRTLSSSIINFNLCFISNYINLSTLAMLRMLGNVYHVIPRNTHGPLSNTRYTEYQDYNVMIYSCDCYQHSNHMLTCLYIYIYSRISMLMHICLVYSSFMYSIHTFMQSIHICKSRSQYQVIGR